MSYKARALFNLFSIYFGWWSAVMGPSYGYPWFGPIVIPAFALAHLIFSPTPYREAFFVFSLAPIGFLIDTAFIRASLFSIAPEPTQIAPAWLVSLWVLLGFSFEGLLAMRRHPLLIALAGLISGPFSYFFIDSMGVMSYRSPLWLALTLHGIAWIFLMPLLFKWRELCLTWFGWLRPHQSLHPQVSPEEIHLDTHESLPPEH